MLRTNFILAQWIVVKLGIERLYWNVTTDLTSPLLLNMVCILQADLITRQTLISCEVFKEPESPYETDFIAYKS